jgi:hypothetical protein
VPVERRDQRRQLLEQLSTAIHRERADHADVGEHTRVVVEPEQERPDRVGTALVQPVAGDDAVGRSLVLDLEHHAFVGLVRPFERLGDDPVEPGALELVEPPTRELGVGRGRRDVDRRPRVHERRLECGPSLGERPLHEVIVAERQQVERDEVRRRGLREELHPAGGGVDPLLEGLELQTAHLLVGHHDLAVDDAPFGQVRLDRLDDLREVPGHRALVAAPDLDLLLVAEDDGPEPVPLRLVRERPGRDVLDRFREHRCHGRHDGQAHTPILHDPPVARLPERSGGDGHAHPIDRGGARDSDPGELRSGLRVQHLDAVVERHVQAAAVG